MVQGEDLRVVYWTVGKGGRGKPAQQSGRYDNVLHSLHMENGRDAIRLFL